MLKLWLIVVSPESDEEDDEKNDEGHGAADEREVGHHEDESDNWELLLGHLWVPKIKYQSLVTIRSQAQNSAPAMTFHCGISVKNDLFLLYFYTHYHQIMC